MLFEPSLRSQPGTRFVSSVCGLTPHDVAESLATSLDTSLAIPFVKSHAESLATSVAECLAQIM